MKIAYCLPQKTAAFGGVMVKDRLLLTGGHEPTAYWLDISDGSCLSTVRLSQPVKSISRDKNGFVAVNGDTLILLDNTLCEQASVRLPIKVTGVSVQRDGLIAVVSDGSVFITDLGGNMTAVCAHSNCIGYAESLSARACVYEHRGRTHIAIDAPSASFDNVLPSYLSFRSLIVEGADVYGLFGYGYIYNCVLPIFSGGLDIMYKYSDRKGFFDLLRQ